MIYSRHIQSLHMNQLEIWLLTALLTDWPLELRADLWKKIQDFSARLIWFSIWAGVGFVWITFKSLQMNFSCLCWILHQVCQAQAETLWTSLHLLLSSDVGHELCCFHVLQMSTGLQLLWQAVYYLTLADRFQEYFEKDPPTHDGRTSLKQPEGNGLCNPFPTRWSISKTWAHVWVFANSTFARSTASDAGAKIARRCKTRNIGLDSQCNALLTASN